MSIVIRPNLCLVPRLNHAALFRRLKQKKNRFFKQTAIAK